MFRGDIEAEFECQRYVTLTSPFLIVTFSFVDYVNILKIEQGNVIHGIDAYAA